MPGHGLCYKITWVWAMLEQLDCRLGIGRATLWALTGHVGRHIMGKIFGRVGWTQGLLFKGH